MFLSSLRTRHLQPEIMDQPDLDPARHRAALAGLARINLVSGSARMLWPAISSLARRQPHAHLRLLDIATGGGDVPLRLWNRSRKAKLAMQIEACDVSSTALEHARHKAARCGADIRFFSCNVLEAALPEMYDVVFCSLFLHHLREEDAIHFLAHMGEAARHLVLVNDLVRSRVGYMLAWLGSRALTRSEVVHVDGPRSVEAAFTPAEAVALAERAGLHGARAERHWPGRYLLTWSRP